MTKRRTAGIAGAVVGLAAAGVAAGLAVERHAIGKTRRADDPLAGEPFGELPADGKLTVTATDGVPLHVETVGPDGAPLTVVFVSGFCLDMGTFHFQRRDLANKKRRLVLYDQRGHGQSGLSDAAHCTIDQLGADLRRVIEEVAPDGPLVLVGHSMGGMTIMALADQWPDVFAERVAGIGLVSTSAGSLDSVALGLPRPVAKLRGVFTPFVADRLRRNAKLYDRARAASADLAFLLTRRYGFAGSATSATLVDYVEHMNGGTPAETIANFLVAFSAYDQHAALRVFESIPTLILCGDRDLLTPVEHSRAIAAALPAAEYIEVVGGGHLMLMDSYDVANRHLDALFRAAAARTTGRKKR
jgi:pimeloyl-ACP methyl ester carboxylesterase